ncbi:hypothetical protein HYC85_010474 [Camellia sinensis]|uniref:Sugar phosphate transporter domain-containing protein n=1 Tax=Camellia sinensis TaxID=4442 RepID=A0A7J7HHZ5_CAMSI|nr:hypothetical protein HYC85_010474 [Camellia sinensis]
MGEMSGLQLGVMGALFLSVASSVSIVICNKALMSFLGFPFGKKNSRGSLVTTLTSWHLMVTYCSLHVAQHLNFFESKPVDMNTVMLFDILNGVSIGFLNLSLGFNSIGFYQMTKLAIIPFTVLLETIFLKKQFSQKIKFSPFLLLVGVGIASITNLQLNFVGAILSLLAVITTCVGQISGESSACSTAGRPGWTGHAQLGHESQTFASSQGIGRRDAARLCCLWWQFPTEDRPVVFLVLTGKNHCCLAISGPNWKEPLLPGWYV